MWALRPGPPEILGFTPLCHTAKFTCLGVIPSVTCCLSSKNLQTQADSSVSFPSQSLMGSKIPQIPRVQLLCGFKVKQLFQGPLADSSDPGCVAKTTYGCPMEHQDTGNLRNFCTDERGRRSSPSWSVWLLSEEPSAAGAPRHTACLCSGFSSSEDTATSRRIFCRCSFQCCVWNQWPIETDLDFGLCQTAEQCESGATMGSSSQLQDL
ncbi:hypothetical protein GN956_G5526 [Arapaima gigas]